MTLTRRDVCALLPALMGTATLHAEDNHHSTGKALPSMVYDFNRLPAQRSKDHDYIPVFHGYTYSGMPVEMHESAIGPGVVVHEMYSHPGDELFLVREGVLEVEFNGRRWEVGPGSVAYVASNTEYAVRNTSKEWTRYFVFLFGPTHPPTHWKKPRS